MAEASFFYEAASRGLGLEFLTDVQHAVDAVREGHGRHRRDCHALGFRWPWKQPTTATDVTSIRKYNP
jgi:hypothetical protein